MERQFGIMSFKWDGNNDIFVYKNKGYTIGQVQTYNITCLNCLSGKLRKPNQFDVRKR